MSITSHQKTLPTLLFADADPELCELYRRFFSNRGYAVETAFDGLECMAKLAEVKPDALIVQRELLWGGGDGVLGVMAERDDLHASIVVLTSAFDGNPPRGIEVVFFGRSCKPFRLTILLDDIRAALTTGADVPCVATASCV